MDFTVTFSEDVTSVDTRDFALNIFGWIRGAAITDLSSNPLGELPFKQGEI